MIVGNFFIGSVVNYKWKKFKLVCIERFEDIDRIFINKEKYILIFLDCSVYNMK